MQTTHTHMHTNRWKGSQEKLQNIDERNCRHEKMKGIHVHELQIVQNAHTYENSL